MTTATLTLSEFLLARIEEDEAAARASDGLDPVPYGYHDHARVLAQCAAHRRIVEEHEGAHPCVRYYDPDDNRDCTTLRTLAAVYDTHPEFQEAWR